jgi:hypothetical protein
MRWNKITIIGIFAGLLMAIIRKQNIKKYKIKMLSSQHYQNLSCWEIKWKKENDGSRFNSKIAFYGKNSSDLIFNVNGCNVDIFVLRIIDC